MTWVWGVPLWLHRGDGSLMLSALPSGSRSKFARFAERTLFWYICQNSV